MWRRVFFRPDSNAELEEELAAHLEIEAKQLMDGGMPRAQAEMKPAASSATAR